jgi:isopentenyldiphosphate isomerase
LLKLNLEENEFNLQKEEVAEVKWLTYDEFKELFYSEDFV